MDACNCPGHALGIDACYCERACECQHAACAYTGDGTSDDCPCDDCKSDVFREILAGTFPEHGWYRDFVVVNNWEEAMWKDDAIYRKVCAWCVCAAPRHDAGGRHVWTTRCLECAACREVDGLAELAEAIGVEPLKQLWRTTSDEAYVHRAGELATEVKRHGPTEPPVEWRVTRSTATALWDGVVNVVPGRRGYGMYVDERTVTVGTAAEAMDLVAEQLARAGPRQ